MVSEKTWRSGALWPVGSELTYEGRTFLVTERTTVPGSSSWGTLTLLDMRAGGLFIAVVTARGLGPVVREGTMGELERLGVV